MDISDTLAPKSDQLDAIELVGKPQTFTITKVSKGNDDQPVNIHLAEFPRVWRPGKSMRRVLAACWGTDASVWAGRRVTLYCDETVTFGNDVTGGTRISHLSHIDGVRKIPLLVKRGKSATFTVQPLPDAPAPKDWAAVVATAEGLATTDALGELWKGEGVGNAPQEVKDALTARAAAIKAAAETPAEVDPTLDEDFGSQS